MRFYIDGGCSNNGQKDQSKRQMVYVVTSEEGDILVDKKHPSLGGSNNIAELLACKEAVDYAYEHGIEDVEIVTDSSNTIAWVTGKGKFKNVNNPLMTKYIYGEIKKRLAPPKNQTLPSLDDSFKVSLTFTQVPREQNKAGHHIENTYGL